MRKKEFDYELTKTLYLSGKSLQEVADEIGVENEDVRRALVRMEVPRRRRGGGDGEKNHQYKGGKGLHSAGYVTIRGKRDPELEHRVIAEEALGKPLPDSVIVHHVDTDRANNANDNLVICTEEYHAELHARMRKHPYWSRYNKPAKPVKPRPKKERDPVILGSMKSMYAAGATLKSISAALGVSVGKAYMWLTEAGIQMRYRNSKRNSY